jgi:hypothetical protein
LNNINALFPDEYRVTIDTKKWSKEIESKIWWVCNYCKEEIPSNKIEVFNKYNPFTVSVLVGQKHSEAWNCAKCNKPNLTKNTKVIRERQQEPYYLKVVPECPIRTSGLQNRLGYHQKFAKWFYKYLEELEYELGRYRVEYAAQMDSDDGDFDDVSDE